MTDPRRHDGDSDGGFADADLWRALEGANVPVLLMLLVLATGESRWLGERYRPARTRGISENATGGLPSDVIAEVKAAAHDVLEGLRRGEQLVHRDPSPSLVTSMLSVCVGEAVALEYGPMLRDELVRRLHAGAREPQAGGRSGSAGEYAVLVIGAGVAGLIASAELSAMGVPHTVVERKAQAGGNWIDNTYPGCGVDTPSHLYSLHAAPHDWRQHFSMRDELCAYFGDVAARLRGHGEFLFGTAVTRIVWDESSGCWKAFIVDAGGGSQVRSFRCVISAVGILNRPRTPRVPGDDLYRGSAFHSATWDSGARIDGARVAIVGTGASAMQVAPAIADRADRLTIVQRSPGWIAPFEQFGEDIPPGARLLLREFPIYRALYWLKLFWQFGDKVLGALEIDPEWEHPERAVNARNDAHRVLLTKYAVDALGDDADELLPAVLPTYPPYGKRILLDNGWFDTLRKPNVELVDDEVVRMRETGLTTAGGTKVPADTVVWCTGFDALSFVSSFDVVGRDGRELMDTWSHDGPRTYKGVMVPGYPNFFILGGPNSFPGSGSFMYSMENAMRYVRKIMETVDIASTDVEPTVEAYDGFNDLVDRRHARMVWSHSGMTTYYRNEAGRVVFVSPFRNVEYWGMTQECDTSDLVLTSRRSLHSAGRGA